MSALTEKVAREHEQLTGPWCLCGEHLPYDATYAKHVATVTEEAVRASVATEIRAVTIQFDNSGCTPGMDYLLSEAYDKGLRVAACISEGKQP